MSLSELYGYELIVAHSPRNLGLFHRRLDSNTIEYVITKELDQYSNANNSITIFTSSLLSILGSLILISIAVIFLVHSITLPCQIPMYILEEAQNFSINIFSFRYQFCSKMHLFYQLFYFSLSIYFFAMYYYAFHYARVKSEKLLVISDAGIQYTVLFKNGRSVERFAPKMGLSSPQIVEAMRRCQIGYFLAFSIYNESKLWTLFTNTRPPKEMLEIIKSRVIECISNCQNQ